MSTVGDLRSGYYRSGALPEDFPSWNKYPIRNQSGTFLIKGGPGRIGGLLMVRGNNDLQVLLYDRATTFGTLRDEELAAIGGVTTVAKNMDGFINFPIDCSKGIVVNIDQSDAIVIVYYV